MLEKLLYTRTDIHTYSLITVLLFLFQDKVGVLPAPALVADSLTATSLSLEWQIPPKLVEFTRNWSHITSYLVQWRYEELGHDWKYCRNQSIYGNSTIKINDLQPFTKYSVGWICVIRN